MNRRFYISLLAFVLTMSATIAFVIGHNSGTRAASTNAALSALPASDFVISIDVQRALNESLPRILSGDPALLAKFNARLEEFERKTGINPRVFESVAIGGNIRLNAPMGRRDTSNVFIVSGNFKSDELIDGAFAAAKKECQFEKTEQQYEGTTIFLIGTVRPLNSDANKNSVHTIHPQITGRGVGFGPGKDSSASLPSSMEVLEGRPSVRLEVSESTPHRFAIAALGSNMIAVGTLESVRATIDASLGRNRVDDELVRLALQTPNSVVGFSGKVPQSLAEKSSAHGSDNPFTKFLSGVRAFYGSFDINGSDAESVIAVRFENAEQARDISQAINSLKALAALGVTRVAGNSPRHDAFAAVLNGLSITAQDNEVRIDARIPQATLTPLIRIHR